MMADSQTHSRPPVPVDEFDRLNLNERPGCVYLTVRVKPKSSRLSILGEREGDLDVALTAPPADGEANLQLRELLARALGIRKSGITIASGMSCRLKTLIVHGCTAADIRYHLRRVLR